MTPSRMMGALLVVMGALAVDGLAAKPKQAQVTPGSAQPPRGDVRAAQAYGRGMDLLEDSKVLEARGELSTAVLSGRLSAQQESAAVKALTRLAETTLLGPQITEGDPYAFSYRFQSGQTLTEAIRTLGLGIPAQALADINGADPRSIQPGQVCKMLRGPVHAVISKRGYAMDLYLQRDGLPPAFLKRVRVGLGKQGRTPAGNFRVSRKAVRPSWTPPPSSGRTRTIYYGQKDYPFGRKGLWLGLQGDDENSRGKTGYALHSTNDQSSIGKARSLGCIRIGDADIDLVYALLAEGQSKVQIRP